MTRKEALRAAIAEVADDLFAFGVHDCCQFARRVVWHLRGADPAPGMDYATEAEAFEIIEAHGGIAGLLTAVLGDPVDVDTVECCDVVTVRLRGVGELVGVVDTSRRVLVPMPRGLDTVPLSTAVQGWRA